jgi:hypothetical protein
MLAVMMPERALCAGEAHIIQLVTKGMNAFAVVVEDVETVFGISVEGEWVDAQADLRG